MDLYDELPRSQLLDNSEFSFLLEASDRENIALIDFLTLSNSDLSRRLKRSIHEINNFQQLLKLDLEKKYIYENHISDFETTRRIEGQTCFTTGDKELDSALGGGIYTHGITEIFGESSTGKTQLLLQLSLAVQLPQELGGLSGKCVYITTEGDLPTNRVAGILESQENFHHIAVHQENIFTVTCNDLASQEHIVNVQLPILLEQNNGKIRLVIIDSISHHMRVELEAETFQQSQENRSYIERIATKLQEFCLNHKLAVVVANQISDRILPEKVDPRPHSISDYDYQIGYLSGWSSSSIMYRQSFLTLGSEKFSEPGNKERLEDILSDDEDATLIERQFLKVIDSKESLQERLEKHDFDKVWNNDNENTRGSQKRSNSLNFYHQASKRRKFKRKIDQRIPNLGLSWSNYLTTRILLKKRYTASPLIKRGELNLYKLNDPSNFWQVGRQLQVVFSAHTEPKSIAFSITKRGIEVVY